MLVAREDRLLSLPDTIALRLHLFACKACPQFENQILTMRLAMNRWRNYVNDEDTAPVIAPKQPE